MVSHVAKKRRRNTLYSMFNLIIRSSILQIIAAFLCPKEILNLALCSKPICKALNKIELWISEVDVILSTMKSRNTITKPKPVDILSMLSHLKFLDKPRLTQWRISSIDIASTHLTDSECILDILQFKNEFRYVKYLGITPELIPVYNYGAFPAVERLICHVNDSKSTWYNRYKLEILATLGRSCNFQYIKQLTLESNICLSTIFKDETPSMLPIFSNPTNLVDFIWNIISDSVCEATKSRTIPWVEEIILLEECLNLKTLALHCVSFSKHEQLSLPKLCILELNSVTTLSQLDLHNCNNLWKLHLHRCLDLLTISTPNNSLKELVICNCSKLQTLPNFSKSVLSFIHLDQPQNFPSLDLSLKKALNIERMAFKNRETNCKQVEKIDPSSLKNLNISTLLTTTPTLNFGWAEELPKLMSIYLKETEYYIDRNGQ